MKPLWGSISCPPEMSKSQTNVDADGDGGGGRGNWIYILLVGVHIDTITLANNLAFSMKRGNYHAILSYVS